MVSIFFPFFNYILFFRNAISYQLGLSLHALSLRALLVNSTYINNNSYRTSISAILSTHLLTQPPEYICFYNAIRDEERRAVTSADRRTTWCIWTRFHRKNKRSWTPSKRHQRGLNNHSYVRKSSARNAPYIHPKYQTACPSSTASKKQRRINMMRNSNLTQLNSNGTRRKRGSNNGGGSIQRPSPPPIQRNRKNIIKGSTIPHGIECFPVGPFAEISIHLKFILITSPNQWSINSASSI